MEIGCGGGDLAIGLAKSGRFEHIDAIDISEGAISLARAKAVEAGVSNVDFQVRDCNDFNFPERRYDFIYSSHALHHIEALEQLFEQVQFYLKDDAIFFADDYIGPSRMQYSDYHLEKMNEVFTSFPPSKRRDAWYDDCLKERVERVPIADYLRIDPSEGVRAEEIIPVMSRFLFTKIVPIGMSIAYECLNGVVRNFDPNNVSDNFILEDLIYADKKAARDPRIPTCFATIIGRKL